ncbi:MAG: 3-hydroxyisobutyrate dehydrogenase [Rhodobacteraceae bacterium]|nr:3-hydroxyisobutyrate dehydrogenase [Paracoccaceae bacterium]
MQIGFIGLGNMGAPMAANLAAAGHSVSGFDPVGDYPDGVTQVVSARLACENAEVVFLMLPNGAIVRSVSEDILPVMIKGAILLDCSTIDVATSEYVYQTARDVGVSALDAPVSGGIKGAADGKLTFMVGGSVEGFAKSQHLFDIMGNKTVHCGKAGAGQAAKLCNNMILGITMSGTCEAFALADKLGLDRQKLYDVVSTSSGYSWSMNAYCPAPGVGPVSPADNDYAPGFAAELMLKDLRLSQQAATLVDADTPMGQAVCELYENFIEKGDGLGKDFSALLPFFADRGRTI